jgi:sugar phosphate isomerase/epimerase
LPHRLFISVPLTQYRRYEMDLPPVPLGLELLADHEALAPEFRADALAIGAELRERGVPCRFHGPFRDLNPGGHDPEALDLARRRFESALELAPAFGVERIVVHSAWDPDMYGLDSGAWLDRAAEFWSRLTAPAAAAGVQFAIENVFDRDPHILVGLLERLPSEHFGALLDIGHWHAYSHSGLGEWLTALGERLLSLHLHDNGGRADEHLRLGSGSVPWREALQAIRGLDLSLDWTLENRSVPDVHAGIHYLGRESGIDEFVALSAALEKA